MTIATAAVMELNAPPAVGNFDYSTLNSEARIIVQQKTSEIRTIARRMAADIIEIGQRLLEVKEQLNHGQWLDWLTAEFEWSDRTAEHYMSVARAFPEIRNGFDFHARALYLLASNSTPPEAREEALQRAEAGETITLDRARDIAGRHGDNEERGSGRGSESGGMGVQPPLSGFSPGQVIRIPKTLRVEMGEDCVYQLPEGSEVTVLSSDGLIVDVQTADGTKLSLFASELNPPEPTADAPVKPQPPNYFEVLERELQRAKVRIALLEKLLHSGVSLFREYDMSNSEEAWVNGVVAVIGEAP